METIWVLGDAVVDLLPDGGANCCNVWRRTGQRRGRGSASGRQKRLYRPGGRRPSGVLCKTLADEQVNTKWLRLDPQHRTSTVVVDLDNDGERSFTFMVRPSADLFLDSADLPPFRAGEWLHVCSIALSAEPSRSATFLAMAAIRQAGDSSALTPIFAPISGTMKSSCVSVLSGH